MAGMESAEPGGGSDPRVLLKQEAKRLVKEGQRVGAFPFVVFLTPVLRIMLMVLEHWLANGGSWAAVHAAPGVSAPESSPYEARVR